jgi:triacylglycerol lipase
MLRVKRSASWGTRRLALLIVVAVAATVLSVAEPAGAQEQPERDPVIFVHGWASTSSVWSSMVSDFRANGYAQDELFLLDYNSYASSNNQTAADLGSLVDQVLQQTGADKVDVVSHSMGSLSSRQCIKSGSCDGKVDDWVSLGGANHGTWIAGLCLIFSYVTCSEMLPGSAYLSELNQAPEVTSGAESWTTLWSPNDGIIIPAQSTILEGADNIELSGSISHLSMLSDATVISQVGDIVSD